LNVTYGILAMAISLALMLCAGCARKVDYLSPERLDKGLVVSLDGVGGYNVGPRWLRTGLDEGGVGAAIHIFNWGHGPAGMFVADLWDHNGNMRRAAEMVQLVTNYGKFYPGRPINLVGHSGGGGMVVFALEQMPEGFEVDNAFLLAPALSPEYNLAPALSHVRRHCYVTHSPGDVPLMGLGTSVFTTMDGKHTVGAGLIGFKAPEHLSDADRAQYAKVRQAAWGGEFLKKGHLGGHMGWSTSSFAREFLAPIMRTGQSHEAFRPLVPAGEEHDGSASAASTDGAKGAAAGDATQEGGTP